MVKHIHKCFQCKTYTLESVCPSCSKKTVVPKPPKFSLEDKFGKYRREIKIHELKKEKLY